jgi:hypothetical protein
VYRVTISRQIAEQGINASERKAKYIRRRIIPDVRLSRGLNSAAASGIKDEDDKTRARAGDEIRADYRE